MNIQLRNHPVQPGATRALARRTWFDIDRTSWPRDSEADTVLSKYLALRYAERALIDQQPPGTVAALAWLDAQLAAAAPELFASLITWEAVIAACRRERRHHLDERTHLRDAEYKARGDAIGLLQASCGGCTRARYQAWRNQRDETVHPTPRGSWLIWSRLAAPSGLASPSVATFALLDALAEPSNGAAFSTNWREWPDPKLLLGHALAADYMERLRTRPGRLHNDMERLDRDWLLAIVDNCPGEPHCPCSHDASGTPAGHVGPATPPAACGGLRLPRGARLRARVRASR